MIAGVDLGGTQVRVAIARSDGRITAVRRARTPDLGGPAGTLRWIARQLERLSGGGRVRAVGVGAPGPLDPVRGLLVNPPNLPGWRPNLPLRAMLEQEIGAPVHVENDANVAAVGEFARGSDRSVRNLVYVTWSTGIGSGLILDGRLFSGSHGSAGEIGHMILDPSGPVCACGQRGCLEAFAGGEGIHRRTGRRASDLFRAAAAGDPESREIATGAARHFGQAMVNLANLVDPEVIVVGGGFTRSWSLVRPIVWGEIVASPFIRPYRRPRLRRTSFGDRVGLVGAVEWARSNT